VFRRRGGHGRDAHRAGRIHAAPVCIPGFPAAADGASARPCIERKPSRLNIREHPPRMTVVDEHARPRLSHAETRTIFFGLMLTIFTGALNQTIVATPLPTIGREYGDAQNLPWLVTAYLLTSTAVAPLFGKLSDMYGRRAMMLVAIGIFTVGSLACALAPTMLTLILGRALQGIGGGGMLPLGQTIVADVTTPRERGRWQAYIGVSWVSASLGGPVLGGFFTDHLHWSLVFWINLPLGVFSALGVHFLMRKLPRPQRRAHRLDLFGAALMMAAAIPLLLALTWGGTRYAWLSPTMALLIGFSAALWLAFSWRLTSAGEPFLPLEILKNQVVRWGTAANTCALGAQTGLIIFLPLYFELVHGLSASNSGLALIPIVLLTTPGSISSGRAMMYLTHYKRAPMISTSFGVLAMAAMAWEPAMSLGWAIVLQGVVGFAVGSIFPVGTVSIQNAVHPSQIGTATGIMNFFRSLGSALVVAVLGAIILAGLGAAPGRGVSLTAADIERLGVDLALVFRWVFAAAAVVLALGIVCLAIMEERPLRGPTPPQPRPEGL
jgi:EmrB/QacA subfamily drug resistance transporter